MVEYVLSLKSLPNIWRDRHWVATKLRSNPEEKANSLYVLQKLWMKLKLKIFNHTVHCTKVLRMQPKKKLHMIPDPTSQKIGSVFYIVPIKNQIHNQSRFICYLSTVLWIVLPFSLKNFQQTKIQIRQSQSMKFYIQ